MNAHWPQVSFNILFANATWVLIMFWHDEDEGGGMPWSQCCHWRHRVAYLHRGKYLLLYLLDMKTATLWLLEGIMVTKKDREYHILSMSDTLSTHWEYDAESMILSAHADILSPCNSACSTESIILSAPHAQAHAESISMRWEYHTLSIILSACCESITPNETLLSMWWEYHSHWEYETLSMRVSYFQRALRVSLWEYHTLSMQLCDFHSTLRVWCSQRTLRVWWYSQRMLILSACASACTEGIILSAPHAEAHAESISMRWEYHTLSIILSACAEYHSRWEYDTLMLRVSYSQRLTVRLRESCNFCHLWLQVTKVTASYTK